MMINEHINQDVYPEYKCPLHFKECKIKGESMLSCKYAVHRWGIEPCSNLFKSIKNDKHKEEINSRKDVPNWDYKEELDLSRNSDK